MMRRAATLFVPFIVVGLLSSGCAGRHSVSPDDTVYLHKAEPGETLEEIAEEYYGNSKRAAVLQSFNELAEDTVEPGTVVRVPMKPEDVAWLENRTRAKVPYNAGLTQVEKGAYVDAVQSFQEALDIDGEFVDAHYNLGVTLQKLKSHERALDHFAFAVRKRPDKAAYHFGRGNCFFYLDRFAQAAAAFEEVLLLESDHRKAQYSLAVSYEKMGERAKAKNAWQRYLQLDDSSAWAAEARKRLKNLD